MVATSSYDRFTSELARLSIPEVGAQSLLEVNDILAWEEILALLSDWEVTAVTLRNIHRALDARQLPDVVQAIERTESRVRAQATGATMMTAELARLLENSGIKTIVLKGPAIGIAAYGDPSLRQFKDIDFLISGDDARRAVEILLSRGYKARFIEREIPAYLRLGHALEFEGKSLPVEIHTRILPTQFSFDMPYRELLDESRVVKWGNFEFRVLAEHHMLVYLCAHGAKHVWSNLKWIADVAALVTRMDRSSIQAAVAVARRRHARLLLLNGLLTANRIVGCPSVQTVESLNLWSGAPPGIVEPPKNELRLRAIHPQLPLMIYWTRCRERIWDKLNCAFRVLFHSTDPRRQTLTARVLRPFKLIVRGARYQRAS